MISLMIFLAKSNWNRHFKHENLLSIYENVNYFQIMNRDIEKVSQIALTIHEKIFSKSFSILILWKCFLDYLNSYEIIWKI